MCRQENEAFETVTFKHLGYKFEMSLYRDGDMRKPWKEHDGHGPHGPVSDWTSRDKSPGEIVLTSDRGSKRFYDWAEAVKIALRDGWGPGAKRMEKLERSIAERFNGRKPTKGEIAIEAVKADFKHLQGWCNDEWFWCGVAVTSEELGETDEYAHACWGIESECESYGHEDCYHLQAAREYAEEIIAEWREKQAEVLA